MMRNEKRLVAGIFVVVVLLLTMFLYRMTVLKQLDSLFLFESSTSIMESGLPTSATIASWPDVLKTYTIPADVICQSKLTRSTELPYNVFDNHAYTALYPIALIAAVFDPELAFALLSALAHLLLLLLPFLFLRRQGAHLATALAFVLAVALYPPWTFSLDWDYYLDRLYTPFALGALYCMHLLLHGGNGKRRLVAGFIASALFAALFTERAAIMMMAASAFYLAFYPQARQDRRVRNSLLGVLVVLGAYLFLYFRFAYIGIEHGGSLGSSSIWTISDPLQRLRAPGMSAFLLVHALFLGPFVLLAGPRYILLAVGALLPNFMVTIGGAELNGWVTHYHSMYLPFIVFVASIGFSRLCGMQMWQMRLVLPVAASAWALALAAFLNPASGRMDQPAFAAVKAGLPGKLYRFFSDATSYERVAPDLVKPLAGMVPPHSRVSAIPGAIAALYESRRVSVYPIDMDSADYLVVSGTVVDGKPTVITGATSYLGPAETAALNRCLSERLTRSGFRLAGAVPSMGLVVLQRGAPLAVGSGG